MALKKTAQTLILLAAFILAGAGFSSIRTQVIRQFQMDELSQTAPDFAFINAQGRQFNLGSFRGKAVILHFWASWCTPCQKELPDLMLLSQQLDSKRWVFLPVSVDESDQRDKVIQFLQGTKSKVPFYQIKDPKEADKYKTWGLPVTYLISPSGEIVARALGRREWTTKKDAAHDLNELFSSSR